MSTYEYQHRAGYGRDDHLADELIARAARQLGCDVDARIAAHAGFISHPCPIGAGTVRLPVERGTRARMEGALRRARNEFLHRPDCAVVVVCIRRRREDGMLVTEERRGRAWVPISVERVLETAP